MASLCLHRTALLKFGEEDDIADEFSADCDAQIIVTTSIQLFGELGSQLPMHGLTDRVRVENKKAQLSDMYSFF